MRNYAIYACSITISIVVAFAVLAFTYKFNFPPFMVLVIALLNEGTIMTFWRFSRTLLYMGFILLVQREWFPP
jgi:hypothetical protein